MPQKVTLVPLTQLLTLLVRIVQAHSRTSAAGPIQTTAADGNGVAHMQETRVHLLPYATYRTRDSVDTQETSNAWYTSPQQQTEACRSAKSQPSWRPQEGNCSSADSKAARQEACQIEVVNKFACNKTVAGFDGVPDTQPSSLTVPMKGARSVAFHVCGAWCPPKYHIQ
jgi:hypothetical protein